jgi:hypothetical protein
MRTHSLRALLGAVVWLATGLWLQPGVLAASWGVVLLLFAALVLVPLVLRLIGPLSWPGRLTEILQLPAALLLVVAFLQDAGTTAGLWSLPWLVVTALVCLEGLMRIRRSLGVTELCLNAGLIFLLVGGLWTSAARLGLRPLDFEDAIVLLTANHFHYAGFTLPILAGLARRRLPGVLSRWSAAGVLAGVPLVAVGITATQLKFSVALECVAALVMATAGLGVAWLYLALAWRGGVSGTIRALWALAGVSLVFGMVLAACYGLRFYLPMEFLTIPWMRALHGTVNVFGFGLAGVVAWSWACDHPPLTPSAAIRAHALPAPAGTASAGP